MKILLVLCTILVWKVTAEDLVVGNIANGVVLGHRLTKEFHVVPFVRRVKNYFYYSGSDFKKIQGIHVLDKLHSKASVEITAGGIGYTFVNLRFRSQRGRGMIFDIEIYVNN